MAAGYRLGIDFGTSHTVAVLEWPDGSVRPLLFDGSPLLRSAVYGGTDGLVAGRDATHAARGDPGRFEPNPKRRIDEGTVLLGATEVPVVDLVGAVLRRVGDEAVRVAGGPVDPVVLTHPAGWGPARRAVLTAAAAAAGWTDVVLLAEPVAAAAHFGTRLGFLGVVYDFGAGTFDASVVRHGRHGLEVLATAGLDDVGGVDLDEVIVERLREVYGDRDPDGWRASVRQVRDDARSAKEMLSRAASAPVHVPGADGAHLGREEFEALAEPLLTRTVDTTLDAIRAAGRPPTEVYLVGGSSRIPLVATLLHRATGVAPTVVEQPELVVALGSLRWRREPPVGVTVRLAPDGPTVDDPLEPLDADPGRPPDAAPRRPRRRARDAIGAGWRRARPFRGLLWAGAILATLITLVVIAEDPPAGPDGAAPRESASGPRPGERAPVAEYPVGAVETVRQLRVTSTGAVVALTRDVSGNVNTLRVRDLTADRLLLERQVDGLLLSPDGALCLQRRDVGASQEMMLVDVRAGRDLGRLTVGGNGGVFGVDGTTVGVWAPGQVWLYDPATRQRTRQVSLDQRSTLPPGAVDDTLFTVAIGPGAQVLAGVYRGGAVQVWNGAGAPVGPRRVGLVVASTETFDGLQLSPDGSMVLAIDSQRELRVWRVADAADLTAVDAVAVAAFSPDSSMLAVGDQDGEVTLYPTGQAGAGPLVLNEGWRSAAAFRASDGPLSALVFSPDGRRVVTAGHGEPVRVWTV